MKYSELQIKKAIENLSVNKDFLKEYSNDRDAVIKFIEMLEKQDPKRLEKLAIQYELLAKTKFWAVISSDQDNCDSVSLYPTREMAQDEYDEIDVELISLKILGEVSLGISFGPSVSTYHGDEPNYFGIDIAKFEWSTNEEN